MLIPLGGWYTDRKTYIIYYMLFECDLFVKCNNCRLSSDSESESDKVSDLPQDDLERGSALIAAFVVAFITVAFFTVLTLMLLFTLSVSGDYQG